MKKNKNFNIKIGNYLTTSNYQQFRYIGENREINQKHVKELMESIRKHGQIQPLVANEKYEIADGQHRLEACKNLNIPVEFIIKERVGIKEVIAANTSSKNWTMDNYIESYAKQGDISFQYLNNLQKKYPNKKIPLYIKLYALFGIRRGDYNKKIKSGNLLITSKMYNDAIIILDYLNMFEKSIKKIYGRKDYFMIGLIFAYKHPNIDKDRLYDKVSRGIDNSKDIATIETAVSVIEELYNRRIRGSKVYLLNDYIIQNDKESRKSNV